MQVYLDLMRKVLNEGAVKTDRTGTGTLSLFGQQLRFNLAAGFPLITTKKVHLKSVIHELLWFLKGDTNIGYLKDNGVRIWNEWADENGDLGPVYGAQWRRWQDQEGKEWDQIQQLERDLKSNPDSRRLIVSSWNIGAIPKMKLPPCHALFQFYVADNKLSCQLYQRSADLFLGVPFNIASYALLTQMLAHTCNLELGDFVHTFGDVHLYRNHVEQARLQITRDPQPLPRMIIKNQRASVLDFEYADFELQGYRAHPHIAAPVAIMNIERALTVSLIVAMGKNRGIGHHNHLPWKLRTDLKRFKEITLGHHLIMGRKTYDSIGRPLPGRETLIITRSPQDIILADDSVRAVDSIEKALKIVRARGESEVFVCGGGEIYEMAMDYAQKIYLTLVDYEGQADTFFPNFAPDFLQEWTLTHEEVFAQSEHDHYPSTYRIYEKN